MARANPERDELFEQFVRDHFTCVVNNGKCDEIREFSHLVHAGMGGKIVPSYGNGVCMCRTHHTCSCEAYHKVGRQTFEQIHDLNLKAVAHWLSREFDGDFLLMAEEPPKGVYRRAA